MGLKGSVLIADNWGPKRVYWYMLGYAVLKSFSYEYSAIDLAFFLEMEAIFNLVSFSKKCWKDSIHCGLN